MKPAANLSIRFILGVMAVFALLSLADLYLTWALMQARSEQVIESNPIAAKVLEEYGWGGMTAYKLSVVVLIGTIAATIGRLRPRTSELLMTFGCGAQAAIVMTSIYMYATPAEEMERTAPIAASKNQGPLLPPDSMDLLAKKNVQAELKFTSDQIQGLQLMLEHRRDLRRAMRHLNLEDWHFDFNHLLLMERALAEGMSPEQLKRLRELVLQSQGPQAFGLGEVQLALKLTDVQIDACADIIARSEVNPPTVLGRPVAALNLHEQAKSLKATEKVIALLTTTQKARWQEMIGTAFVFNPPPTVAVSEQGVPVFASQVP